MTFIGEYNCKVDSKFRLSIPAGFRKVAATLGDSSWVVRRNPLELSVDIIPLSVWNSSLSKIRERLNPFNKKHADFMREYYRGALLVEMDSAGRILLPRALLESVKIDKELLLAGMDDKIVAWNPQHYKSIEMTHSELAELAQEIFKD